LPALADRPAVAVANAQEMHWVVIGSSPAARGVGEVVGCTPAAVGTSQLVKAAAAA
jgi:hypothetical protein